MPAVRHVTATVTTSADVYRTNMTWATILIAVSIVLLLCALISLVLRFFIVVPDILGYVSTLTRDNPDMDLSIYSKDSSSSSGSNDSRQNDNSSTASRSNIKGLSLLNGIDRSRRFRDLRVRIADVAPEENVGHIALVGEPGGSRWIWHQVGLSQEKLIDAESTDTIVGKHLPGARLREGRFYD